MANYFISPTGNDSTGNGTQGNPYKTADKAYAVSASGDTIAYLAGTYAWNDGRLSSMSSGRNLAGIGIPSPIIDGAGQTLLPSPIVENGAPSPITVSVTNLTFQNVASLDTNDSIFRGFTSGFNASLTNCTIILPLNHYGLGLFCVSFAVTGCICVITDGEVTAHQMLFHYPAISGSTSIINSTFYLNKPGALQITEIVYGNLPLYMRNVIIENATGATVNWQVVGSSINDIAYCDFHLITGSPTGTGILTSDPVFLDPTNHNFGLAQSSPCIGTGTPI